MAITTKHICKANINAITGVNGSVIFIARPMSPVIKNSIATDKLARMLTELVIA